MDETRSFLRRKVGQLTEAELISNVVAAFLLGLLLSWIFFGSPILLAKEFAIGTLGEWAAAVGTFIVGFGAWKYARATHFHTLDRADAERIAYLERKTETLSLMAYRLNNLKGGKSSVSALDEDPAQIMSGLVHSAISTARDDISSIQWSDGEVLAFSVESRAAFARTLRFATSAARRCTILLNMFPDSSTALDDRQKAMLEKFRQFSDELAQQTDVLIELANQHQEELLAELKTLRARRTARSAAFNFNP